MAFLVDFAIWLKKVKEVGTGEGEGEKRGMRRNTNVSQDSLTTNSGNKIRFERCQPITSTVM